MLTGDNRRTAEAIGRQLEIDVEADLLPEDKQRIVGRLREEGRSVAKIGDGINDAPALAAADVAMGAAPTSPWRLPTPPCCTDGSPTSSPWSTCRNGPWLTCARTSPSHLDSGSLSRHNDRRPDRLVARHSRRHRRNRSRHDERATAARGTKNLTENSVRRRIRY